MLLNRSAFALFVALAAGSCREAKPPEPDPLPERVTEDPPGIHNLMHASDRVYCGSEPYGEAGFTSLQKLGITTIVSVDGAKPDLQLAQNHGLRYVHIPIGYEGVSENAALALTAVARTIDGPIYVHCHHGQHRGPAATAVLCLASGKCNAASAKHLLELAGTGKEYAGLWRDVANFQPPPADCTLPPLVAVAELRGLTAKMAKLDRHWDNLRLCEKAGWKTPSGHPDLSPLHEAMLVKEFLRESGRELPTRFDAKFREEMNAAEAIAEQIEQDLKNLRHVELPRRMKSLEQSCKKCHGRWRN